MTYTDSGVLEDNLEQMVRVKREEKDKHTVILVVGDPGTAKSALSFWMTRQLSDNGIQWSDVAFTHDQYIEAAENGRNRVVWYDEGRDSFYKRRAMSSSNTEALDSLMQHRFRRHIHIVNFQNLSDMELDLLYQAADYLVRTVKQGWFHAYNKQQIQRIEVDKDTRTVDWPDPGFRDGFDNPEKQEPELWEMYKDKNEEKLEEDDDDDGEDQEKKKYRRDRYKLIKTLRNLGLSQSEVGEEINVSRQRVSQIEQMTEYQNTPPVDVSSKTDAIDGVNA
jgi:DNA-binding XRE family transcriptional regulator